MAFPKYKKQWVVKKVYTKKTYEFREKLMQMLHKRREDKDVRLGECYVDTPELPTSIANKDRPDKEEAVTAYRTRFKLDES